MNIIDEIFTWAKNLPKWQGDAVRRIFEKGEISVEDQNEIILMVKEENGLCDPQNPAPTPSLILADGLSETASASQKVCLKSMYDLSYVNALEPNQSLEFKELGVTVIYGENATGKSSYSRVLKSACRARDKEKIVPNIFELQPDGITPEAKFCVLVDGTEKEVKWIENAEAPEHLGSIAVYDSKCARVYLDQANDVVYIPYGLDVFEKLAHLYNSLKTTLQGERNSILGKQFEFSMIEPDTAAYKMLKSFTSKTLVSEIDKLVKDFEGKKDRWAQVKKSCDELKANDPKIKASEIQRKRKRFETLLEQTKKLDEGLQDKNVEDLKTKYTELKNAQEASKLASTEAFRNEPLSGVGEALWREMFEAAKNYSEQSAYPNKPFPVTEVGSFCLLCQQELQDDAKDRLRRFWNFIQEDIAKKAEDKKRVFNIFFKNFKKLESHFAEINDSTLEEIGEAKPDLKDGLLEFKDGSKKRWDSINSACSQNNFEHIQPSPKLPLDELHQAIKSLDVEIKNFQEMVKEEERKLLLAEFRELESHRHFFEKKDEIFAYVEHLKKLECFKKCIASTKTTGITVKGKELSEKIITQGLNDALLDELKAIGLEDIKINLKKSGESGKVLHELQLTESLEHRLDTSEILSEGEQCAVSVSAFLAELKTSSFSSGIVFDDPVSSLDHIWREKVARRLVQEGQTRQVIIFTHDLVFLRVLEDEAGRQQVMFHTQNVKRVGKKVGICDSDIPWQGMSVKKRIGYLKNILQNRKEEDFKKEFELISFGEWFYGTLREVWERVIEEVLYNDSVQRFRHGIETNRLLKVKVENEAVIKINEGMSKCSKYLRGHDTASGAVSPKPDLQQMNADLEEVESFIKEIKQLQQKTEEERKKVLKPPNLN